MKDLVQRLNAICDEMPFKTSWFLKDLKTGKIADKEGAVIVASASTRKISIMMAALKDVNDGRLSLDQPVVMQAEYQKNDSGAFQHLTPGFSICLRDAMVMMIIVSDNTCTGTVGDMVGVDRINEYCRSIGMTGTTHTYALPPGPAGTKPTQTTPNDQGLLLELILNGSKDPVVAKKLGVTPDLCNLALDILSWQLLNTRMPNLLPAGTRVAHKTGTGPDCYNDVGIVYQGKEKPLFILATYTREVPVELPNGIPGFAAAAQTHGRLARAAYDALKD